MSHPTRLASGVSFTLDVGQKLLCSLHPVFIWRSSLSCSRVAWIKLAGALYPFQHVFSLCSLCSLTCVYCVCTGVLTDTELWEWLSGRHYTVGCVHCWYVCVMMSFWRLKLTEMLCHINWMQLMVFLKVIMSSSSASYSCINRLTWRNIPENLNL